MVEIQECSSWKEYIKSREPTEVQFAHLKLENDGQATIDEMVEINLGTSEEPMHVFICANLYG